jgi:GNAT superfamily N-acetyltransferase
MVTACSMLPPIKIIVRSARVSDLEILAQFNLALAQESENLVLDAARVTLGVRALLVDSSKGIYYVAEAESNIIGQVLITYEWSDWRNGNFWWLQSVYVQKDFRSRGVFKMLFAHIVELARLEKDVCGLRLYMDAHNGSARLAYERLGMKQTNYQILEQMFTRSGQ